jgi:hypothetical protein
MMNVRRTLQSASDVLGDFRVAVSGIVSRRFLFGAQVIRAAGLLVEQTTAMWAALRAVRLIQLRRQPWRQFTFARMADIARDGGHRLQIAPRQRIELRENAAGNSPANAVSAVGSN